MKSILLWAAAQACLVHAISPPDAPPIPVLRSTGFAGSGCPQSSDTIVQFRNNVLTLSTPELVSSSGSRSVCTTQIELTNTSGWQFAINQVLMNGQANMSADSRGSVNLNVFYSGYIQAQASRDVDIRGSDSAYGYTRLFAAEWPADASTYSTNLTSIIPELRNGTIAPSSINFGQPAFGPCGGDTVINFQISAESDSASEAVMNDLTIEKTMATLMWRKC